MKGIIKAGGMLVEMAGEKLVEMTGGKIVEGVISVGTKVVELGQTHDSNMIAKKANEISKASNEIAEVSNKIAKEANEYSRQELKETQKGNMPKIELVKGVECRYGDIEDISGGIVFDFHGGIIFDDNNELCLDDYSEYLAVFLEIENTGMQEINAMAIDSILISFDSKNEFEVKLDRGIEIDKALFETECNCKQSLILKPEKKKEIVLLFACEEVTWLDADRVIDASEQDNLLIQMDVRLFSINNSVYEQKSLWCEYQEGKRKECSYESIVMYDGKCCS